MSLKNSKKKSGDGFWPRPYWFERIFRGMRLFIENRTRTRCSYWKIRILLYPMVLTCSRTVREMMETFRLSNPIPFYGQLGNSVLKSAEIVQQGNGRRKTLQAKSGWQVLRDQSAYSPRFVWDGQEETNIFWESSGRLRKSFARCEGWENHFFCSLAEKWKSILISQCQACKCRAGKLRLIISNNCQTVEQS